MKHASEIEKKQNAVYKGVYWFNEDHPNNPAFFAITKNASTSMRNTLRAKTVGEFFKEKEPSGRTNFTIIRNPIDRFVSGFLEVCALTMPKKFEISGKSMIKFIDDLKEHFFNIHILPQVHFVSNSDGELIDLDYWILFDNLEEEYYEMCENISLPRTKLRKDRPTLDSKKDNVIKHMTPEIKDMVISVYKDDWELYNKLKNERSK